MNARWLIADCFWQASISLADELTSVPSWFQNKSQVPALKRLRHTALEVSALSVLPQPQLHQRRQVHPFHYARSHLLCLAPSSRVVWAVPFVKRLQHRYVSHNYPTDITQLTRPRAAPSAGSTHLRVYQCLLTYQWRAVSGRDPELTRRMLIGVNASLEMIAVLRIAWEAQGTQVRGAHIRLGLVPEIFNHIAQLKLHRHLPFLRQRRHHPYDYSRWQHSVSSQNMKPQHYMRRHEY